MEKWVVFFLKKIENYPKFSPKILPKTVVHFLHLPLCLTFWIHLPLPHTIVLFSCFFLFFHFSLLLCHHLCNHRVVSIELTVSEPGVSIVTFYGKVLVFFVLGLCFGALRTSLINSYGFLIGEEPEAYDVPPMT